MDAKERNRTIDILKGVCIIIVVVSHFAWSDTERKVILFPFWRAMAIPVFMIISGMLYAKSFDRKGINTFEQAYLPKNVINKIVRYTMPFMIAFAVEIILHDVKLNSDVIFSFLRGGVGQGKLLLSDTNTVGVLFPDHILYSKKISF